MARITGRVRVTVNGEPLLNKEGAVASGISQSGKPPVERIPVIGDGGLHGYKETMHVAQLEVSVTDRDDVKLSDLADIDGDGTVIFAAEPTGKQYIMDNATCHANFSITAGEGETKLVFSGPAWTEV